MIMKYFLIFILCLFSLNIQAEPSSAPVTIIAVRPYMGGSTVYISIEEVDANFCGGTNVFTLSTDVPNGKSAYAVALLALAADKKVILELQNGLTSCGWAAPLQSIYLLK